ncbi:Hsp20/alpha crystallin family protein [Ramlibacter albus]|uniref:Hsp20/alpha crystallin family protein n=1 Tax=Ramlibacter albus TaxID=2079448 RepID=A0A923MAC2_9BURK|nr:Hsp20/alpha crystallin family protein [Ramlibacter albus]MBC5766965.1 Hsp20/alpha crystallin family protein [Ramlibacter albus]
MTGTFRSSADMFAELNRLQGILEQAFRPHERASIRALPGAAFPVLNVGSTAETIEIQALAPGLDANSLEITLDRGLLTVAGERKSALPPDERGRASVYARERFAGRFRRVVTLPDEADPQRVDATYRDGILRITVHKREASKPRRIEVN